MKVNQLKYEITGVASTIGRIVPIDEWCQMFPIKNRKTNGYLSGRNITKILGIESKSWDPELFSDSRPLIDTAKTALRSAELGSSDIDAIIAVTCTPLELNLGQDVFRLARELELNDDIITLQLEAGCGGLARMMSIVSNLTAKNILVVAYNYCSRLTIDDKGKPLARYSENQTHPQKDIIWATPALFSDGIGAMILSHSEEANGISFYSRDQLNFGDKSGFKDSIVSFLGGGVLQPPGIKNINDLMCFAMSGQIIANYYNQGMLLNYKKMIELDENFLNTLQRMYIHQAGPKLVQSFFELSDVPEGMTPTHARKLGNLVSPCTIKLLHDDLISGRLEYDKKISFCLVGAGPERGGVWIRNKTRKILKVDEDQEVLKSAA